MRSDAGAYQAEADDMLSDAHKSGTTPDLPQSSDARTHPSAWVPVDEILVNLKTQQALLNDRLRRRCREKLHSPINHSAETTGANFLGDRMGQPVKLKLKTWGPADEVLVKLKNRQPSLNDRLVRRGCAKPQSPIDLLGSLVRSTQLSALRSSGDHESP